MLSTDWYFCFNSLKRCCAPCCCSDSEAPCPNILSKSPIIPDSFRYLLWFRTYGGCTEAGFATSVTQHRNDVRSRKFHQNIVATRFLCLAKVPTAGLRRAERDLPTQRKPTTATRRWSAPTQIFRSEAFRLAAE